MNHSRNKAGKGKPSARKPGSEAPTSGAGKRISPARDLAFRTLLRVADGAYATEVLRHETPQAKDDARDLALAETIVLGCLRYQAQLDYLITVFSGRRNLKLDPEVRIALRMGIYQLRYLDRIPAHAAVTESVELVKRARKRSAAPLVNAILRKVHRDPVRWPDLATELSVPAWLLDSWTKSYGADAARQIALAALEEPETPVNPDTGRRQDVGARSIVPLLDVAPGMRILDLCAAPGNKTAQILAAVSGPEDARPSLVVACDRYPGRAAQIPEQALRIAADATAPLPFPPSLRFDRILLDAPCSGTGTLARNPEIKWRLQPKDLARFAETQRELIRNALPWLAPGGKLVYATCSLERAENQDVIAALDLPAARLGEPHLRLPGRDPGDGFFAISITAKVA